MMITITQDNIYKTDFSIADLKSTDDLEIISEEEILYHLSDFIELGESVTFGRFFEIISLNKDLIEKIYHSCLGGYSLTPFMFEIEDIPDRKNNLDYVEICWSCDKYDDEFNISSSFHGIGSKDNGEEETYAIEFTPLNNLKNLPLRLNTNLSYFVLPKGKGKKAKDVYLGDRYFTLYDVLYAILFEITFNGDPKNRNSRLAELEDIAEESSAEIESGKYFTAEEMEEELENFFNDEFTVKYNDFSYRLDPELISDTSNIDALKNCFIEKFKLFDEIEKSKGIDLTAFDKKLTDIEFNIQTLYGIEEDIKFHRFWDVPKCTCPKIDNSLKYPNGGYSIDRKCPIHKNKKTEP